MRCESARWGMPKAKGSLSLHRWESAEERGCLRDEREQSRLCGSLPFLCRRAESGRQMQKPRCSTASPAAERTGHTLLLCPGAGGTSFRTASPSGLPHSRTSPQEQKQRLAAPRQAPTVPAARRWFLPEKAGSRIPETALVLPQVLPLPCRLRGCAPLRPLPGRCRGARLGCSLLGPAVRAGGPR